MRCASKMLSCGPSVRSAIAVKHTFNSHGDRTHCDLTVPGDIFVDHPVGNNTEASCAIVGSSGVLSSSQCRSVIDNHDLVFRMNMAPTRGFEDNVGSRTSVQLVNSQVARAIRSALLEEEGPGGRSFTDVGAICEADFKVFFYGDEWLPNDNAAQMVRGLNRQPRCQLPALVGNQLIRSKALQLSKAFGAFHGTIPRQFDQALALAGVRYAAHCDPSTITAMGGRCIPTAGFYAAHLGLALCRKVTLFGMHNSDRRAAFHYFDDIHSVSDNRSIRAAHDTHNLRAERLYYRFLTNRTALRVCHTPPSLPPRLSPPEPPASTVMSEARGGFNSLASRTTPLSIEWAPTRAPAHGYLGYLEIDRLLPDTLVATMHQWLPEWLADVLALLFLWSLGRAIVICCVSKCLDDRLRDSLNTVVLWASRTARRLPFRLPWMYRGCAVSRW